MRQGQICGILAVILITAMAVYLFTASQSEPAVSMEQEAIFPPKSAPADPDSRLLLVQVRIYLRKPVHNSGFMPFVIDKETYTFNGQVYPRPCFRVGECAWSDYRTMLRIILNDGSLNWTYLYMLEDDTYFCGDRARLEEIMAYGFPIVATGIGGSGNLISRQTLSLVVNSAYTPPGFDLLISYHFPDLCYRYYMELTVHLYEGSLYPGRAAHERHGALDKSYPACFEVACGNYQPSGVGNMNWYNLAQCRGIIEKSSDTQGCLVGMAQVNETRQMPHCGKHCKTHCKNIETYLMLQ